MDNTISTFPKKSVEAIALMYVEKHATSEHTASDMYRMYCKAYYELCNAGKEIDTQAKSLYK